MNEKITAFYCRSSAENKFVIDIQKQALLNHAESRNIEKYRFYSDRGFSGTNLDRPALKKLIADVTQGIIGTVMVTQDSRLFHNSSDENARCCRGLLKLKNYFERHNVKFVELASL